MPILYNHLPHIKTFIPGPESRKLSKELSLWECPQITYMDKDFPIFWNKAKGMTVYDVDGNRFLDLTAAFGVVGCGHGNPQINKAAQKQMDRLSHAMGDVHPHSLKVQLSKELAHLVPGKLNQTIFSSSGAEAVESALKTAQIVTGKPGVISMNGAYHGLTLGALSVTSWSKFKTPFKDKIAPGSYFINYPNPYLNANESDLVSKTLNEIRKLLKKQSKDKYSIGAIILEPIQGRGGCIIPADGFLRGVRELCDQSGILLIVDEIYTGFGRTGNWFAVEHENIEPDLICLGKGMANGFPISVCMGSKELMSHWGKSQGEAIHTSTFLGHPVGCAMALATIHELKSKNLIENSRKVGDYFLQGVMKLQEKYSLIGNVRGRGLMIGVELVKNRVKKTPATQEAIQIMKSALKKGLILLTSGEQSNILCITPPLIINQQQVDIALNILDDCFHKTKIQ